MQQIWRKKIDGIATDEEEEYFFRKVDELIYGVLNINKFDRFEPREDLIQEAWVALMKEWDKFNPDYDPEKLKSKSKIPTLFNYYSLVAKQAMFYYTKRRQKHRNTYHDEYIGAAVDFVYEYERSYDDLKRLFRQKCEEQPTYHYKTKSGEFLRRLPYYFDEFIDKHKDDPHSSYRLFVRHVRERFIAETGHAASMSSYIRVVRRIFDNNEEQFKDVVNPIG